MVTRPNRERFRIARPERAPRGRYPPPVRLFAAGTDAVGVIAVGQQATGVIAIGQLATGVVAVGQLARGVVVVGQLAVGVAALGQLAAGPGWAAGMVGVGGTGGPILVLPLFGTFSPRRFLKRSPDAYQPPPKRGRRAVAVRVAVLAALGALWWWVAGAPLLDELTRVGGILREPPPPPRPLR